MRIAGPAGRGITQTLDRHLGLFTDEQGARLGMGNRPNFRIADTGRSSQCDRAGGIARVQSSINFQSVQPGMRPPRGDCTSIHQQLRHG